MPFEVNAPIDVLAPPAKPAGFNPEAPIEALRKPATFSPDEEIEAITPPPALDTGYHGPMTTGQALTPGGGLPSMEDFIVKSDVDPDEMWRNAKTPATKLRAMYLKFFGSSGAIRTPFEPTPMIGSEAGGTEGGMLTIPKVGGTSKVAGATNAISKFAAGLTSPENVALLLGTQGAGAVAELLPATRAAVLARVAEAGAIGGFTAVGIHDTVAASKNAQTVLADPEATGADKADALATALLSAAMAAGGAYGTKEVVKHSTTPTPKGFKPLDESVAAEANRKFAEKSPPAEAPPQTFAPDAPIEPVAAEVTAQSPALEPEAVTPETPPVTARPADEAPAPADYQYTLQRDQATEGRMIPGYLQIDELRGGENTRSSNLEDMRKEGIDLPDVPDSLPSGRYTLAEIREAIAKEATEPKAEPAAPPAVEETSPTFQAAEPIQKVAPEAPPAELPPISEMTTEAKKAELQAAGFTEYRGKPLDALTKAELTIATGKARRGKLEKPAAAEPLPAAEPATPEAKPAPKATEESPPAPPAEPPPPVEPAEFPQRGGATGIKNATVTKELESMKLPPAERGPGLDFKTAREEAERDVAKDPEAGKRLLKSLEKEHRPATGYEDALMAHEFNRLRLERDAAEENSIAAAKSGDAARIADAEIRVNKAYREYQNAAEINAKVGSSNSHGLNFRKMMLKEDFSLAAIERRATVANGGKPLTKEQRAEVVALRDRVAKAEKDFADYQRTAEGRLADVEAENAVLRFTEKAKKAPKAKRASALDFISEQATAARARIAARRKEGRVQSNVDPLAVADHIIIGAEYFAKGVSKVAEWSAAMVKEFGKLPEEYLKNTFAKVQRMAKDMENVESGTKGATDVIRERMKEGGTLEESRSFVQKLAEDLVRGGIHERNALIDAVHTELKAIDPEITRRETMDAISGYGDLRRLNPDEVKAELRDLKGQMQQVAKLEDLQAGKAPAKTGVERRIPSAEERALIKQVEEAKRKSGIVTTDPATQLKSTLESIKTRLKNQIDDLERQIGSRKKDVEGKTPVPTDAEAVALKARRDALKEQFDAIFGKPGLTEAQQVARASKAYDLQIAELERQLRTNELFPDSRTAPKLESAELDAKRARIDALKAERDFARHLVQPRAEPVERVPQTALGRRELALERQIKRIEDQLKNEAPFTAGRKEPPTSAQTEALEAKLKTLKAERTNMRDRLQPKPDILSDAEISLAAFKKRTTERIAELKEKLAKQDFEPKEPKEKLQLDDEGRRLKSEVDMAKTEVENAMQKAEYQRLTPAQKALRNTVAGYDASRALMTTGEFSFMLRQGKYLVAKQALLHPVRTAMLLPDVYKALKANKAEAHALNLKILDDPEAAAAREAGLYLAEHSGKLSKNEETFMGKWTGKIPVVRNLEQASTTFLNTLRFHAWRDMTGSRLLKPVEKAQIAKFINQASGRGSLGALEPIAVPLARTMFSPRFFASRLQLLLGESMWDGTARSRGIIAQEYAKNLVAMGVYYALLHAALGHGDDESTTTWDPRSSDFGKIKIGNTRLDPLAGLAQMATFIARTVTGERTTTRGQKVAIRGDDVPAGGDRWSKVALNFARSKLHPIPAAIANLFDGTDLSGNKADLRNQALNLSFPITYVDIYQALKERNVSDGVALGALAMLGEGLQTYGPDDTAVQSTYDRVAKFNAEHGVKPKGTASASDYTDFNKALQNGKDEDKVKALQSLIATKVQAQVGNMSDSAKESIARRAVMDYYRQHAFAPFTGSAAKEQAFKKTLDAKGLEEYAAARQERRETFRTVQGLLRQQ